MTPTTVEEALLADVLANPEDDTPRLILADWLQQNGQEVRGEFIVVQCELARNKPDIPEAHGGSAHGAYLRFMNLDCHFCELERRERELLPPGGFDNLPTYTLYCVPGRTVYIPTKAGDASAVYHRGFVEEITLSAEDWLTHHAALLASCPLRVVRLTTWPARSMLRGWWLISPEWGPYHGWFPVEELTVQVQRNLKASWPHLTFHLPDDHG